MTAKREGATEFKCQFCSKKYTTERYLLSHACERGRRFRARNEMCEKQAYQWYSRFYQKRMSGPVPNEDKFETSLMYTAFVRFARYLRSIHAINSPGFVDFLIAHDVKIDDWNKPSYYERYVREWTKSETPVEAMKRNFLIMEQWAIDNNDEWTEYFRKVSPSRVILYIVSGRISPWIIFTASSAQSLIERFSGEQMDIFNKAIDVEFWKHKLKANQKDVEIIRQIMNEINL